MAKKIISGRKQRPLAPTRRRRVVQNPDPDRHYRWSHKDQLAQHMEDDNYRIERRGESTVTNPASLEGAIMSGGDILTSCPMSEWLEREAQRVQDAEDDKRGPIEAFKMQAQRSQVEVIDLSKSFQGPMSDVVGGGSKEKDPKINSRS